MFRLKILLGVFTAAFALVGLFARPAFAQTPTPTPVPGPHFESLSKPLNYAADSVVSGNLAYVASGRDLYILDISDPRNPSPVGQPYHVDGCDFVAVDVSEGLSFVAQALFSCSPRNSLFILDVSNPENPRRTGEEIPTGGSPGGATELDFEGGFVYLAFAQGGLRIIEVNESGIPGDVWSYTPAGVEFRDVKARGNTLYLTDASRGIWLLDVSNKAVPDVLDTLSFPNHATGIDVFGNLAFASIGAYLPAGNGGLAVVDISDPEDISQVGEITPLPYPESALDIEVEGNYAFIASDAGKIFVFDISSPNHPELIADFYQMGPLVQIWRLTVSGDLVLSSNGNGGLEILRFTGLGPGLNVPYLNQTDPEWGDEIYDSADTLNLGCEIYGGPYIKACGCATTSAAMLLRSYGVYFSPEGLPTNPKTLNSWLIEHKGYNYGAVKWPSIATYSVQANFFFGSQKIQFIGFGARNDFITLDNDLNDKQPVILEEPGHFVIAKAIQGNTYLINDPRWENRTTLQAYNNSFLGTRRFEKTNTDLSTLYITAPTPSDLFLIDSQGRRTGRDPTTGEIYLEIPNSYYLIESTLLDDTFEETTPFPEREGVTTLAVINPTQDEFILSAFGAGKETEFTISAYDTYGEISVEQFRQGSGGSYEVNYSPEPGTVVEVTRVIKIDIKPGDSNNSFNCDNENGLVAVAVLTDETFDARMIDQATVVFEGAREAHINRKTGQPTRHEEDVDGDGDIDLVFHFRTRDTQLGCNSVSGLLVGETFDGSKIKGSDTVGVH